MYMFKTQDAMSCMGELDLDQVVIVEETTDKEQYGRVIRVLLHGSPEVHLLAPKEADFGTWWDALTGAMRVCTIACVGTNSHMCFVTLFVFFFSLQHASRAIRH